MSEASPNEGGIKVPQEEKKSFDLSGLIADSHLSKPERDIIVDSYKKDKEKLFQATQSSLKSFILRDYGAANMQSLGGFDGVVALQKALKVDPADGSFGPDTFKALIEYQKNNNLTIDGIAGTETMGKLGITTTETAVVRSTKKADTLKGKKQQTQPSEGARPNKLEVVSGAQSIKKYTRLVGNIEDQIKSINESKKENTGIIGGIGDWIGEKTGAYVTGKQIYEGSLENSKEGAKELHAKIISEFGGKILSPSEKNEVDILVTRLEKAIGTKLNGVSWGTAVFNSLDIDSKKEDTVESRTAHAVLGLAEGGFGLVEGVLDLSVFLVKYGFSSEYRKGISKQYTQIKEYLEKNGGLTDVAIKAFKDEIERISHLPANEMSGAIGKITGVVIGTIASGGVLGGLSKGKGAATAAKESFTAASRAAELSGNSERAAALAFTAAKEGRKAMAYAIGGIILNGPAESAIGATLSNSFRFISNTLRGGASAAHKLKTVEKGIGDFDEAIKRETNPENLKHLQEAKEALETEKNTLIKQMEAKVKKPEKATDKSVKGEQKSGNAEGIKEVGKPPKSFEVNGVDVKKLYRQLASYYHPDRNGHPDASKIMTRLNELKNELENGTRTKRAKAMIEEDIRNIAKNPEEFLNSQHVNTPKTGPKEKADFYAFKDGSTVEKGSFDATGAGEGRIKRLDGSFHEGKFVGGELEQGMVIAKNGEKFIFNKNSKIPLMREVDNKTMGKIHNHESVRGEIPTMKWTHRTTADVLEQILRSGKIGTNADRGVNFWGGLGAGYGDISLIMKKDVQKIRGAKDIAGDKVTGTDNMVYFFGDQSKGNGMRMEEYSQKFGDFTNARVKRGENPHVTDPYLMVGERGSQFTHEVDVDMIEAVILPSHVKSYLNYPEIKAGLEARGIQIIEAKTSSNVLNYSGGSILNVIAGGRSNKGAYAELIRTELTKWYPDMPLEDAAIAHLKSTGAIPMDSRKTFQEHLEGYNKVANNDGLSRGEHTGGEFQNYASHKNHAAEQQSYFNYLVESKYRNFSEMPSGELSSLLEGYLTMPELLKQKGVSPKEIHGLLSALENTTAFVDVIVTRNSSHRSILSRLAA